VEACFRMVGRSTVLEQHAEPFRPDGPTQVCGVFQKWSQGVEIRLRDGVSAANLADYPSWPPTLRTWSFATASWLDMVLL
jgi:hypothetical protein